MFARFVQANCTWARITGRLLHQTKPHALLNLSGDGLALEAAVRFKRSHEELHEDAGDLDMQWLKGVG